MKTPVPLTRYVLFFVLAIAGLAVDLISKAKVFESLGYPFGQTEWLMEGPISFRLHTTMNEGALWGIGQGMSWGFAGLSVVAMVGVLLWLFVYGAAASRWLTVALGFILAGTMGNLYDRLALHGCVRPDTGERWYAVRDFLYFKLGSYDWPVFNPADVFLVTGAVMLVIQSFFPVPEPAESASPENEKAV